MPDVYDEIFKFAREYIQENSIYSPYIYKDTPEVKEFPLVIIRQIRDGLYSENLDKSDQRFDLSFEIEIYTMNKGDIAKQVMAEELIDLVNNVFDEHYGMNRVSNRKAPNVDTDVYRWNMMFEAKIDESKRIYRR